MKRPKASDFVIPEVDETKFVQEFFCGRMIIDFYDVDTLIELKAELASRFSIIHVYNAHVLEGKIVGMDECFKRGDR